MQNTSAEEYLDKKVRPIIESLAHAVISERPKLPVSILY